MLSAGPLKDTMRGLDRALGSHLRLGILFQVHVVVGRLCLLMAVELMSTTSKTKTSSISPPDPL